MLGENYEKAGDLAEAHRWMNLGLSRHNRLAADGDPAAWGIELFFLFIVRSRIRRSLRVPADGGDRLVDVVIAGSRSASAPR
jgi:hypothetical protein